jgi:tetratricopeptide (TPR) repeat protein
MAVSSGQLYQKCLEHLNNHQYTDAFRAAQSLVKINPARGETWHVLSVVLRSVKRFDESLKAIEQSLLIDRYNPVYLVHKAHCLISLGLQASALSLAREVRGLSTTDPRCLIQLAEVFQYCDQFDEYLEVSEQAAQRLPEDITALSYYSEALRYMGRYAESETVIEKLLAIQPHDAEAHYARSQIRKVTQDNNHIAAMLECLSHLEDWRDQMKLCYAVGKEYEDIGDTARAFHYFSTGAEKRKTHSNYNLDGDLDTLMLIAERYTREAISGFSPGFECEEPIFVLGLPRSGTTLVESILDSHSDVFGAGELKGFTNELTRLVHEMNPERRLNKQETVEASLRLDWKRLGRSYIESTRPRTGHTPRFVDKMPQNYLYIGLIASALPRAKIILLERNPMDVCYAMFKTLFAQAYPFSYSLEDLGQYYIAWRKLMDHWKELMPGIIHTVHYEQLVNDTENEARKLLSFCELEWQAECLQFHRRSGGVSTASASQVRQPVYSSSVNKWRALEDELAPLKKILQSGRVSYEKTMS